MLRQEFENHQINLEGFPVKSKFHLKNTNSCHIHMSQPPAIIIYLEKLCRESLWCPIGILPGLLNQINKEEIVNSRCFRSSKRLALMIA